MFAEAESSKPKGKAAKRPVPGDVVKGVVTSIGKDAVFVDVGGKSEGVLDREQVVGPDGELRLRIGDTIEARVAADNERHPAAAGQDGQGRPRPAPSWCRPLELGIPVEGKVTGLIKGGLEVDVAGVRAFCRRRRSRPASSRI